MKRGEPSGEKAGRVLRSTPTSLSKISKPGDPGKYMGAGSPFTEPVVVGADGEAGMAIVGNWVFI